MQSNIGISQKSLTLLLIMLLLIFIPSPFIGISRALDNDGGSIANVVEVVRTPKEVYSRQAAIVFIKLSSGYPPDIRLEVSVTMNASINTSLVELPSLPTVTYTLPVIPVSLVSGWYMVSIPGLPARTIIFQYTPRIGPPVNINFTISSRVEYKLIVNGETIAEDSYKVLKENISRRLPPVVITTPYELIRDPLLIKETLGLGPKGWVFGNGKPFKALVVAFDEKGFNDITNVIFEYKVDEGSWIKLPVNVDPLMQNMTNLVDEINSLIHSIEDKVREIKPDFDLPDILRPCLIGNAVIPAQNAGTYVMFRANATDVDGNMFSSPICLYYVVNKDSITRILVVDPHVKLWLLQENIKNLNKIVRQTMNYQLPGEITNNSKALYKVSDVIKKYGVEPFHHWEMLGKYYDLYIACPGKNLVDLLKGQSEGGYEPHVIILSNLWLGYNKTGGVSYWDWDLRDIKAGNESVLEHLINYVKKRHAGLIATHGTLSDEVIWTGCGPEDHYKVGARGHVGYSPADVDILEEKSIAALLGVPELAIWEYLRDGVAELLCTYPETQPIGLAIGSMPLQVPNVPWNGTLRATSEARYINWSIPEEMTITIPSIYNELGFRAYTQVGWQLGLPRAIAYTAWQGAHKSRPLIKQLYGKLSMLIENVTSRMVSSQVISDSVDKAAKYGLRNLDKSIISANITGSLFNLTISIPELNKNISMAIDIGRRAYESMLQKLPVKIIAESPDGIAGIIVYDKYWNPDGYRSVYFSFEVEAAEGDIAETLLVNAVNWTLKWQYKNVTDLLGGLVRVPKDMANKFNETLTRLPGNLTISKALLLNEEGLSRISINVTRTGVLHILVAHPTTEKIIVDIIKGPGTIINITSEYKRLTRITLNISKTGEVILGLRAASDSPLNPAYISAKQEAITIGKPRFEVSQLTVSPLEAKPGEEVNISVVVKNVGDAEGTYTVFLKINGTTIDSKNITLAPNESRVITFTVIEDKPGIYLIEVDGQKGYIKVLKPPEFIVSGLRIEPKEAEPGGEITISVNVTNTGELSGSYTVVLKINGTIINSKTVTLDAGESGIVSFTVSRDAPGTYEVTIDGLKDYFIIKARPPEFKVSELTISKSIVKPGETITISVKVTNVGGSPGSYTVNLKLNGNIVDSKTVKLDPGESTIVTFVTSMKEAGTYNVNIDGLSRSFTVKEEKILPPSTLFYTTIIAIIVVIVVIAALIIYRRGR